jgi:hypothetical protein
MTSPIDRVNNIEQRVIDLAGQARAVADVVSREVSEIHRGTSERAEARRTRIGRWVEALAENNGLLGGRARSAILAEMRDSLGPGYIRLCTACDHTRHVGKACSFVTVSLGNRRLGADAIVDCPCTRR